MSTEALEQKVAHRPGFYGNRRIRVGDTFTAPASTTGSWFATAGTPEAAAAARANEPDLLDRSVAEILAVVPTLERIEIERLISAEQAGKTRKSLLAKLQDELDNRLTGDAENPFA